MKFSEVTSITVPEGNVTKITAPNGVLWQSSSGGGDGGGGGGGVETYTYSGSTTVSGLTYLRCQAAELNGSSSGSENLGQGSRFDCEIINISAMRNGTNETGNIVSKIQNGVVTYYDDSLGEDATTTYKLAPYQHPGTGYIIGIELRIDAYGDDGEPVIFDGTYTWSFSEVL